MIEAISYTPNSTATATANTKTMLGIKTIHNIEPDSVNSMPSPNNTMSKQSHNDIPSKINCASLENNLNATPLVGVGDSKSSEHSIKAALSKMKESEKICGSPDQANHVRTTLLDKLKKGHVKEAIEHAYDSLPSGVVPRAISATLATAGLIGGTVACIATGGAAPVVAATVIAGISAVLGAGDALRAYKTRHCKEKPFANDMVGHLINTLGKDKHRKVANAISSTLRVMLLGSALACAATGSSSGHSSGHSNTDSHSAHVAHVAHKVEEGTLMTETGVSNVELRVSETAHNINGHLTHTNSENKIVESTDL